MLGEKMVGGVWAGGITADMARNGSTVASFVEK